MNDKKKVILSFFSLLLFRRTCDLFDETQFWQDNRSRLLLFIFSICQKMRVKTFQGEKTNLKFFFVNFFPLVAEESHVQVTTFFISSQELVLPCGTEHN